VAGVLYGALVALVQGDMKRLIAYSSVSHLGFCMLGVFAANRLGWQGGVLQMINHGLSTGGLFAVVGMLYERYHTRQIADFGGLAKRLPVLAFFTLVLTLSSIGLPGLNGFAGEFLLLLGMFQRGWAESSAIDGASLRVVAVLSVAGVVLGAWYMLWLVQRVFFGPLREPRIGESLTVAIGKGTVPFSSDENRDSPPVVSSPIPSPHEQESRTMNGGQQPDVVQPPAAIRDLSRREILTLSPLLIFILWIGLQPSFFLDRMTPTLDRLLAPVSRALSENGFREGGDCKL